MKPKNLRKKIRRLEKRLREGSKKLAKLKQKLQAAEAAKAMKGRKKSAGGAIANPPTTGAKKSGTVKNAKRKLNLSAERRAQLSAAMKARWTAKRAAEANAKAASADSQYTEPGLTPQAPESRRDGA